MNKIIVFLSFIFYSNFSFAIWGGQPKQASFFDLVLEMSFFWVGIILALWIKRIMKKKDDNKDTNKDKE